MNQNGNDKVMIDCPNCKQRFSAKMPKPDDPLNTLKATIIVATHEKPVRCICGAYFVFGANAVQIGWTIIPITDEQAATLVESPIVIPPAGSLSFLKGNG
jgi:hypothetical protein